MLAFAMFMSLCTVLLTVFGIVTKNIEPMFFQKSSGESDPGLNNPQRMKKRKEEKIIENVKYEGERGSISYIIYDIILFFLFNIHSALCVCVCC